MLRGLKMENIETGVLLPGAELFSDSNINPTWKGHVRTNEGTTVVFAKLIDAREICIEAFCAILGRKIGIPIPKPFLILADSNSLPSIPDGQHAIMFGSEDAAFPSFRRYADCEQAYARLQNFKATLDVGAFDEWIANHDRNLGNILYDGGNDFLFIDHGLAIPDGMNPCAPASDNNIIRALFSIKSEIDKYRDLRTASKDITPTYKLLKLEEIMSQTRSREYLTENEVKKVVDFLTQRLSVIDSLIRCRLGLSQVDMFDGF